MVTTLASLSGRTASRGGTLRAVVLTFLSLLAAVWSAGRAAAGDVTASLEQESVRAGEGTTLTIEITNGQASEPQAPAVPDLVIRSGRREQQIRFINGQTSSTTTYGYTVGSMKPGNYTIPPFTLTVDGVEMKTQPLKLKVLPSASQQPPGMSQGNAGNAPPAGADSVPDDGRFGFLTVELAAKDRAHAWVGEIAPVRIKAWLPENARVTLTANLQPEGSAFTLHNLSKEPQQGTEVRNGKRYTVLTWYGGLSAAKAGSYPPDLTLKASVAVRDRSARRQRPRSPFGRDPFGSDPFADFDDFFAPVIQKDVVLSSKTSDASSIEVRPLPVKGKPADFSGAVGKFAFENVTIPDKWQTGEPQQIKAAIGGEGNFNLLHEPALHPAENWKSYPGQSDFTAKDVASFAGAQNFRFNAVPRKAGKQDVHLAFTYFDPDTARYETATSPVKQIEVTGADLQAAPVLSTASDAPKKPSGPDSLAPLHTKDTAVQSLTPLAFRPAFRTTLGISVAAMLAGLVLGRLRSVREDPRRIAREATEKATRAALHEAETFASRGDIPGFFAAARHALQVRLAALWSQPAQAITLADVTARVPANSPVVEFFREADRLEFSPSARAGGEKLTEWRSLLHSAMQSLTASIPAQV